MSMISERLDVLLDLVLPTNCVSCGAAGRRWCDRCRPAAGPAWVADRPGVAAAVEYAGPVRDAMLDYKERGGRVLAGPLATLLARAVRLAADGARSVERGHGSPPQQLVLVPVPSRRAVARSRGGDHVLRLARLAAAELPGVTVRQLLTIRGRPHDSAGLTVAERAANVAGRMVARPRGSGSPRRHPAAGREESCQAGLIVVDDIVTTGATLAEAERALLAEGWPAVGAAVVAATRLRRPVAAQSRSPAGARPRVTRDAIPCDAQRIPTRLFVDSTGHIQRMRLA